MFVGLGVIMALMIGVWGTQNVPVEFEITCGFPIKGLGITCESK